MISFLKMLGSYFIDPADRTVLSSKRANGFIGLVIAIVLAFTTKDPVMVGIFLSLTGVEGLATAIGSRTS